MEQSGAEYIVTGCGSCGGAWQHALVEDPDCGGTGRRDGKAGRGGTGAGVGDGQTAKQKGETGGRGNPKLAATGLEPRHHGGG